MRRVPVILLASLVVVLGLFAAPVYSGTLFGNDTPDIRLGVGEKADNVFDLDDFFDSATSKTIGYTKDGSAVADGVVSVAGSSTAGKSTVKFVASASGETLEKSSVVQVSSFRIANVPAIDNNNRLAGVAAGNAFLNGIVPGKSVASAEALALVGGGSFAKLTGGSATGSAALIATIGEVGVTETSTGLVVRSAAVKASGKGTAAFGGLTATLKSDGTYSLAADSTFAGPFVVTLGASGGASADGVHVLAAKAADVAISNAFYAGQAASFAQAAIAYSAGGAVVTAKSKEAVLVIAPTSVATGDFATVSMNFVADKADASVAVIAFDTKDGLAGVPAAANKLSYDLLSGGVIEAGKVKNAAVTARVKSGSVVPAFQVFNPGTGDLKVTISSIQVINARPLVDFAVNPNADAALSVAGDLTAIAGLSPVNAAVAGTADAGNHFASANGSGCLKLTGAAKESNMMNIATVDAGSFVTECWVKKVSSNAGTFFLHTTDGVKETQTQIATDGLGADWEKVINTGVAKAGSQYVVVQAVNSSVLVDDMSVRLLADSDRFFDISLLGP